MALFDSVIPRTTSRWSIAKADGSAPTTEALLLDVIVRLHDFRQDRQAVHIHLSNLQRRFKKADYLQLATDMFEAQVKNRDGRLFTVMGGDLVFLVRAMPLPDLVQAVDRLRILFSDDPLAQYSRDGDEFATYYNLERDYTKLRQDMVDLSNRAEKERKARKNVAERSKGVGGKGRNFEPADLSKLIAILERADLASILRHQTACKLDENGKPTPIFKEAFVSIDDLQKICTPDIDLLSNHWLFHYLTRTLDKRVLAAMCYDGIKEDIPFSLNLNISSLLSPEFRRFDSEVPNTLRGKCLIEIHKVDVFSDIGAFLFARDFLHNRGYQLCLDGLTHHTLPFFDNNQLGLDYFKIHWAPEGLNSAHAFHYPEIKQMISEYGSDRVILCRCDSDESLRVGKLLGITRFQGRIVDALLLGHRK
jgi:hypothetical protein